jgi:hypothetical protein
MRSLLLLEEAAGMTALPPAAPLRGYAFVELAVESARRRALDPERGVRTRWAAHNVRLHETGVKDYHHSVVGDLNLTYNRIELSADPGLAITV